MTSPLFQLGEFQFDLRNGAPQSVDWNDAYRWEQQDRLLREPANQWLGVGAREVTFEGVLFPGFSGRQTTVQGLRSMAETGKPFMLTDGRGRVYGRWCIKSLREAKDRFMDNGDARRIGFTMALVRYGEDTPGQAASPLSVIPGASQLAGLTGGIPTLEGFSLPTIPGLSGYLPTGAFTDWINAPGIQGFTQAATGGGFSLSQLANIAATGASLVSQISSGDYVNTALSTFGLFGIDAAAAGPWAQAGINAANLAQSFVNGQGATGMALALESAAALGVPAMQQLGLIRPEDNVAIGSLFNSAATIGEILKVDPKVTEALRPLITLPGGN
jgi:phage protein U